MVSLAGYRIPAAGCSRHGIVHVDRARTGIANRIGAAEGVAEPDTTDHRSSGPPPFKIKGLEEFASAIWERRKHIPSQSYGDPLIRLFDEFDKDHDGKLTAAEVSAALQSRQVELTEEQAQLFIDAIDGEPHHCASREDFPVLVFHMVQTLTTGPSNDTSEG